MPDLAKIAYEAYGRATGGLNYQGLPMPAWDELPDQIRHAWDAAAQAILRELNPEDEGSSEEGKIREAMRLARENPGRVVTVED